MMMLSFISIHAYRDTKFLSFPIVSYSMITSRYEIPELVVPIGDSSAISCFPPFSQTSGKTPICKKNGAAPPWKTSTYGKTAGQSETSSVERRSNTSPRPVLPRPESTIGHSEMPWTENIFLWCDVLPQGGRQPPLARTSSIRPPARSEEHTSELQSLAYLV